VMKSRHSIYVARCFLLYAKHLLYYDPLFGYVGLIALLIVALPPICMESSRQSWCSSLLQLIPIKVLKAWDMSGYKRVNKNRAYWGGMRASFIHCMFHKQS
jgi:hypothetical protein